MQHKSIKMKSLCLYQPFDFFLYILLFSFCFLFTLSYLIWYLSSAFRSDLQPCAHFPDFVSHGDFQSGKAFVAVNPADQVLFAL